MDVHPAIAQLCRSIFPYIIDTLYQTGPDDIVKEGNKLGFMEFIFNKTESGDEQLTVFTEVVQGRFGSSNVA